MHFRSHTCHKEWLSSLHSNFGLGFTRELGLWELIKYCTSDAISLITRRCPVYGFTELFEMLHAVFVMNHKCLELKRCRMDFLQRNKYDFRKKFDAVLFACIETVSAVFWA